MNSIERVGVVGAGAMGNGIAHVCAQAGRRVVLVDAEAKALDNARAALEKNIKLLATYGIAQASSVEVLQRIEFATKPEKVKDVDIVIEAIPEKLPLKAELFKFLGTTCRPDCIFASNTSSIPITRLAAATTNPDRVIGTHFFQPAHLIPLVEVVEAEKTSEKTIENTLTFMKSIGKRPVRVRKDLPGFVGNRLQQALTREAYSLIQKGIVTAEDLDTIVTSGFALRMVSTGPIQQKDLNGLDTVVSVSELVYPDLENAAAPLPIVRTKVAAGELGVKTGKGLYDWKGRSAIDIYDEKNRQLIELLCFLKDHKWC